MFNLPPMCALTFHLLKEFTMEMSLSPSLSLVLARVLENSLPLSCAISPTLLETHVNFQYPNLLTNNRSFFVMLISIDLPKLEKFITFLLFAVYDSKVKNTQIILYESGNQRVSNTFCD